MLSCAGALGARHWPDLEVSVAIGCNADDAAVFPDCRYEFLKAMSETLLAATAGVARVGVAFPFVKATKAQIVSYYKKDPKALSAIQRSTSCYRGVACGDCDACALRAAAFATHGVEDLQPREVTTFGGERRASVRG